MKPWYKVATPRADLRENKPLDERGAAAPAGCFGHLCLFTEDLNRKVAKSAKKNGKTLIKN